jgi:hypothetical protein
LQFLYYKEFVVDKNVLYRSAVDEISAANRGGGLGFHLYFSCLPDPEHREARTSGFRLSFSQATGMWDILKKGLANYGRDGGTL